MKYKHIKQNNSNELILFFNGWGCDDKPFNFLEEKSLDVIMLYDYNTLYLDSNLVNKISQYEKVTIIAWSFGVWVAQYVAQVCGVKFSEAIAYNGTLKPVHKTEGIPVNIAQGTLDKLTYATLEKFRIRMVGTRNYYKKYEANLPTREFDNIQSELGALYEHFIYCMFDDAIFSKAVIGEQDMIFLAQNQQSYWENKVDIIELEAPHFCFYNFKNWSDLIV